MDGNVHNYAPPGNLWNSHENFQTRSFDLQSCTPSSHQRDQVKHHLLSTPSSYMLFNCAEEAATRYRQPSADCRTTWQFSTLSRLKKNPDVTSVHTVVQHSYLDKAHKDMHRSVVQVIHPGASDLSLPLHSQVGVFAASRIMDNVTVESQKDSEISRGTTDFISTDVVAECSEKIPSKRKISSPQKMKETSKKTQNTTKRTRDEDRWARNVRKKARSKGESYISVQGKVVPARSVKPVDCSRCKFNCPTKVTENERQRLFKEYWDLESFKEKVDYIASRVHEFAPLRPVSGRRAFSKRYTLKINNREERVCKEFFVTTFDISESTILTYMDKKRKGDNAIADLRGKQTPSNKTSNGTVTSIREHILSQIGLQGGSFRSPNDNTRNVKKLYRHYQNECDSDNIKPASISVYRKVYSDMHTTPVELPLEGVFTLSYPNRKKIKRNKKENCLIALEVDKGSPGVSEIGAVPPQIGAVPQQLCVVPQQLGAVPQQLGTVPQQLGAVPQQLGVVPQQIGVIPQQLGVVPQQIGAVPQQLGVVPQQLGVVPQQIGVVPQQIDAVPQQIGPVPQQIGPVPQQIGEKRCLAVAVTTSTSSLQCDSFSHPCQKSHQNIVSNSLGSAEQTSSINLSNGFVHPTHHYPSPAYDGHLQHYFQQQQNIKILQSCHYQGCLPCVASEINESTEHFYPCRWAQAKNVNEGNVSSTFASHAHYPQLTSLKTSTSFNSKITSSVATPNLATDAKDETCIKVTVLLNEEAVDAEKNIQAHRKIKEFKPKNQPKKRCRNEESWERNVRKKLRFKGEAYTSVRGKLVEAKRVKKVDCSKCKFKCTSRITEEQRVQLNIDYWNLDTYKKKIDFLTKYVEIYTPKRKMTGRRSFSRKYTFAIDSHEERVCKDFFKSTLHISESTIATALEKSRKSTEAIVDLRGKHKPVNKTSEETLQSIRELIIYVTGMRPHRDSNTAGIYSNYRDVNHLYQIYKYDCERKFKKVASLGIFRNVLVQEFCYKTVKTKKDNLSTSKICSTNLFQIPSTAKEISSLSVHGDKRPSVPQILNNS